MSEGFVKLLRGDVWDTLEKHPDELHLLLVIAKRARRTKTTVPIDLHPGQALIGDWKNYGFSEQTYRRCKSNTLKWGYATYKPTPYGTIATLLCSELFDLNISDANTQPNTQPTDSPTPNQHPTNTQPTTNKKERRKEGKKSTPEGVAADAASATDSKPMAKFEASWLSEFESHFGCRYVVNYPRDRKALNVILPTISPEELIEVAKRAWKNPDGFWSKQAVTISSLCYKFNEIRAEVTPNGHKPNGTAKPVDPGLVEFRKKYHDRPTTTQP